MSMEQLEDRDLARLAISLLDLTDLGDDTDADAVDELCDRAVDAGVAAVCVWPAYVAQCVEQLTRAGSRSPRSSTSRPARNRSTT